ncbi:hypothetical protein [Thioalkalivibrio sulfidiphilus]|uniref:hypothetical protein n=1 Tax=Thioalkalivibrio sulfidiphilus TaxID=1033854 RepID=UPI003B38DA6B
MNAVQADKAPVTQTPGWRRMMPLWILLALFSLPVAAAWWFYLNPDQLPAGRKNLGVLIEPVVALDERIALRQADGAAFDPAQLHGKWTLVTLSPMGCADPCRGRLVDMRQIRLAVGEGRYVVERLLIVPQGVSVNAIADEFPGMHVALIGPEVLQSLQAQLPGPDSADSRMLIMDPMGNLMMTYAEDAPAKHVLRDMEFLLKASRNWVKGAGYGHR